jgi:hypothetical protein
VLNGEATNSNFIVFGLTRSGLEPTIYHTRGEHANHYTGYSRQALGDIFSQLCKHKQLKRYKAVIDNCLKCSEKKYDLPNNEADIQDLKLKGPGPSCQNVLHDGFIAFDHWSLDSLPNMDNNFSLQLFHKTNQFNLYHLYLFMHTGVQHDFYIR